MASGLSTRLIHAGHRWIAGAVTTPTFQSATYTLDIDPTAAAEEAVRYVRLSNTPNHEVLRARLADAEGAEDALVTASGMAAISATLLGLLSAGDHLIVQSTLYGGTAAFLTQQAARLGISCSWVDAAEPDTWTAALRPATRLFYLESIANPRMSVGDLPAAVRFAQQHGLWTAIDNTFASPVNFRPIPHGFDLVLHSATKYLNGHSDIAAGVIAGRAPLVARARAALSLLGGSLDPHACMLLERGLKTLVLRMRQHNESALALARMLQQHPAVAEVLYPGLPSSLGHDTAARLFSGFGGMLSFSLMAEEDAAAAAALIGRLRLAIHAPSLGGVETLVVRPATSSHLGMTPQARRAAGIPDGLIRVSVGIEDTADILADFQAALAPLSA